MRKTGIFSTAFFSFCLFFCAESFSDMMRTTSFDNRGICEKSRGVWRQFGNGCVDECSSKFDQFSICTNSPNFGCDCGKARCWNGETCVTLKDYKKVFDEDQKKEQEVLDEIKKKRQREAKDNQQEIMENLIAKASSTPTKEDSDNKQVRSNFSEVLKAKSLENVASEAVQQKPVVQANVPAVATTSAPVTDAYGGKIVPPPGQQKTDKVEELPPIIMPGGEMIPAGSSQSNQSSNVPPFFLQQEQAKQKAAASNQNQNSGNQSTQGNVPTGLPEIPLPN